MALIKNIDTMQKFARTNFTNQTSKMPDVSGCENRYIIPLIGTAIYADLQALADADDVTDELLILVRKAIAPLTYYKDLPVIHLQIGDKGIGTFIDENVKSAARWEFNSLRDYYAEEGCAALEVLLQYLFDNKEDLEWEIPDSHNLLFLTGKEFAKYFPLFQPYRTFEFLRTISRQVEDEFLIPNIGEDFFEALRDIEFNDDEDIAKKEKKALVMLKKAAAFHTIRLATDLLPVKFSGTGFTVLLSGYGTSDNTNPGDTAAPDSNVIALKNSCIASADTYMQQLMNYLQANASEDLFPLFFESDLYINPSTEVPKKSINEETKNFYM